MDEKLKILSEGGTLLTEAYFGKNEILIQCEELLDKALKSPTTGIPEIKQVEILLQKLFNFERLIIAPYSGIIGATIPASILKFESIISHPKMEKSKYGGVQFKSSDKVKATMLLDIATSANIGLTGSEFLAIILHEIGHSMRVLLPSSRLKSALFAASFSTYILSSISDLSKLKSGDYKNKQTLKTLGIIAANILPIYGTKIIGSVNDKINMFVDKYISNGYKEQAQLMTLASTIAMYVKVYKNRFDDFMYYMKRNKLSEWLKNPLIFKYLEIKRMLTNPLTAVNIISGLSMNFLTMKEETFSDYVAAIYGYGPEVQSGLNKYYNFHRNIGLDNPITRLLLLPTNIVNAILDPHPKNITRIQLLINNLEVELSKGINTEHFNEIKEELERAKKVLEDVKKTTEKSKYLNFDIIIYRKIMDKLIKNNDDIRAIFFNLRPKDLAKLDGLVELPYHTKDPESLNESATIINESFNMHNDNQLKQIQSYLLSEAFDNTLNEMIDFWKE